MQDRYRAIPQELQRFEERKLMILADIDVAANNLQCNMAINGIETQEKNAAGTLIVNELEYMDYGDKKTLTDYRGFKLELSKNPFSSEIIITGKSGYIYSTGISKTPAVTINRIDELLDTLNDKIKNIDERVEHLHVELKTVKGQVDLPFKHQDDYDYYKERKNEIDRLIGNTEEIIMDESETDIEETA